MFFCKVCKREFINKQSLSHHEKMCKGNRECNSCGKVLTRGKFCSLKCSRDNDYKLYIEKWLNEEINGTKKSGHSNYLKRYLIEMFGEKCSLCGWDKINQITKKVPVEVDHIDGNHKNNKSNNIRLLCPNCHSLTVTYKALNKGKGRKFRAGVA